MIRTLRLLATLLAVAAAGAAAWLVYVDVTEPVQALTLAEADFDLGLQIKGEKLEVPLRVTNSSRQPWRIINLSPA